MPRRKKIQQDDLLSHNIIVRINAETFRKLEKLQKESDCSSIAEVVRKILSKRKITYLYRDISMNGPMEELALIRKEIKAIGININQQTHRFHTSQNNGERAFHALKTASIYKQLEPKIDELLNIVSKLAKKWLQRS